MIDLDNVRQWIVWGFTKENNYCTHSHIHEGFYRALKLTGKNVLWLDHKSDLSKVDFSDSFFITEHRAALSGMPIRDDSFYCCHGLNNDIEMSAKMSGIKNRLSHNVYHDFSHGHSTKAGLWDGRSLESVEAYNAWIKENGIHDQPDSVMRFDRIFLDTDVPFYPQEKHMDFRWATDLLPHEIEANKPGITLTNNKRIYYVGTHWFVNEKELSEFKRACDENRVDFCLMGAGQNGVVSQEDNVHLIRRSYFAPAILGSHHLVEGYLSCRALKNISYGRMLVTNSAKVNAVFGGKGIYNSDCYALFHDAVDQLKSLDVQVIHDLMDFVAKNHTYLNRIDVILKAARLVMEMK